jgi:hypothetical protein
MSLSSTPQLHVPPTVIELASQKPSIAAEASTKESQWDAGVRLRFDVVGIHSHFIPGRSVHQSLSTFLAFGYGTQALFGTRRNGLCWHISELSKDTHVVIMQAFRYQGYMRWWSVALVKNHVFI